GGDYRRYLTQLDAMRERNRNLQTTFDNMMQLSAGDRDRAQAMLVAAGAAMKEPEFAAAIAEKGVEWAERDLATGAQYLDTQAKRNAQFFNEWVTLQRRGLERERTDIARMKAKAATDPLALMGGDPSSLDAMAWNSIRQGGRIPFGTPAALKAPLIGRVRQLLAE